MGINFDNIKVENFISIGEAELKFDKGVYLIKGINTDLPDYTKDGSETKISNGAGKTTMFSAVYQGLYNRNSKDNKATVNNVNNLYTKKPYCITISFTKAGDTYKVTNDRSKNKIMILKNGEDISPKGITNQLTVIKNIIGFDFNTFASLTFLNQNSLDSIIDLTNKDNIVYQFFDIEALNRLEKSIKQRRKAREEDRVMVASKMSVIKKQLSVFVNEDAVDIDALKKQETVIKASLDVVERKYASKQIKALEGSIATHSKALAKLAGSMPFIRRDGKAIKEQIETLKKGVCPTCGQEYDGDVEKLGKELEQLREEYKRLQKEADKKEEELEKAEKKLEEIITELDKDKEAFTKQLRNIQVRILVEEEKLEQRENLQKSIDELEEEFNLLGKEIPEIEQDIKIYDTLLAVFKSGAVVNEYLRKYKLLFVKNFRELQKHTMFDIDIKIKVSKGKMTYIFIDNGVEKTFSLLSAGEKTRVSLMLLLATLKTIEQLTNITINYLVLDELLGVLDGEGINFLKNVLSTMRKNKCIYIISHHNEIEDSFADGIITVIKEDNISRIE
jgi:DNA repair exonuclease SbcCD ATPase subunit